MKAVRMQDNNEKTATSATITFPWSVAQNGKVSFDQSIFSRPSRQNSGAASGRGNDDRDWERIGPRNEDKYEDIDINEFQKLYLNLDPKERRLLRIRETRVNVARIRCGIQTTLDHCFTPICEWLHRLGHGSSLCDRFVLKGEFNKSLPSAELKLYSRMKQTVTLAQLYVRVPQWRKLKFALCRLEDWLTCHEHEAITQSTVANDSCPMPAERAEDKRLDHSLDRTCAVLEDLRLMLSSWNGSYRTIYEQHVLFGIPLIAWHETKGVPLTSTRGMQLSYRDFQEYNEAQTLYRALSTVRRLESKNRGSTARSHTKLSNIPVANKLAAKKMEVILAIEELKKGRTERMRLICGSACKEKMSEAFETINEIIVKLD